MKLLMDNEVDRWRRHIHKTLAPVLKLPSDAGIFTDVLQL